MEQLQSYLIMHRTMWGGSSTFICLYALAIIVLIRYRKEYPKLYRVMIPILIMTLILAYFPLFYRIEREFMPRTNTEKGKNDVYARIRWILLMVPVIAFAATVIWDKMDKVKRRVCALVVALMLIFLYGRSLGAFYWDTTDAKAPYYKIPKESITIADMILEENKDYLAQDKWNYVEILAQGSMHYDDESKSLEIARGLRHYASPVKCVIISNDENEAFRLDPKEAETYRYVICEAKPEVEREFTAAGFKKVWGCESALFMEHGLL